MTTTVILNAQSIGTGANTGTDLFAYKLTPAAGTTQFTVEGKITNGTLPTSSVQKVRIWYAGYSADITASTAPAILRQGARYLDVAPGLSGQISARLSVLENLTGAYAYFWFDVPAFATAGTLTVTTNEFSQTTATLSGDVTLSTTDLAKDVSVVDAVTQLETLVTKTPDMGQALAAASTPVVLTAAQISTLTPLTTITANIGTAGTLATAAKQDTGNTSLSSIVTSIASIDTKSPTTIASAAKQDTGNTSLASIDGKLVATAQRTPAFSNVTTGGTVAAGKRKILFIFSSDYSGNVGGIPFLGNVDQQIEIPIPTGDTCDAVVYTVSTGSIRIITF